MRLKNSAKQLLLAIGIGGIGLSLLIILGLIIGLPVRNLYVQASPKVILAVVGNPGLPINIKIPKIKVNANLESVGLNARGEVDVPRGPNNAAWFNLGPQPGDKGNAVLVGHYGIWKNGTPTVFNNLSKLRQGDKISIKDKAGVTITFIVRELKVYSLSADATAVFIANDDQAHLNLITCEGTWNKVSKSYANRLVVFADKE